MLRANGACFCINGTIGCGTLKSWTGYDSYFVPGSTTTTEGFTRTSTTSISTKTKTSTQTVTAYGCGADQAKVSLFKQNYFCNAPPKRFTGQSLTGDAQGCMDYCCGLGYEPPYYFDCG